MVENPPLNPDLEANKLPPHPDAPTIAPTNQISQSTALANLASTAHGITEKLRTNIKGFIGVKRTAPTDDPEARPYSQNSHWTHKLEAWKRSWANARIQEDERELSIINKDRELLRQKQRLF